MTPHRPEIVADTGSGRGSGAVSAAFPRPRPEGPFETTGHALAVVAHPDDESFGLGAVLAMLAATGSEVSVVCFTHGEASTLGAHRDLGEQRRMELSAAADVLGISDIALYDFADGALADVPAATLDEIVERHVGATGDADLVVVFAPGGVTGHPDHQAATAAARRVADIHRLAVLEWGVSPRVADALNRQLGTAFVALDGDGAYDVEVDDAARRRQREAIACHVSQSTNNAVLTRRLELQGSTERIRVDRRLPR